jgi:cytochrome bd ubiquinol oxidase subunit II
VFGGTLLLAAFPVAYTVLLPAFYVPLVLMLFALIFRGLAFEFRFWAERFRHVWDWAFSGGSTLAGFCQGVILGAFLGGIPVHNGAFAGGTFQFASAFAVVCGLGLVAGYALLGATWLIFKTAGTTGDFGRRVARPALFVSLAFIALISLWSPITHAQIARRWFSWPNIGFLWPRSADGRGNTRKTMIVALARKLLIGLWRMATTGEIPQGVALRAAA